MKPWELGRLTMDEFDIFAATADQWQAELRAGRDD